MDAILLWLGVAIAYAYAVWDLGRDWPARRPSNPSLPAAGASAKVADIAARRRALRPA